MSLSGFINYSKTKLINFALNYLWKLQRMITEQNKLIISKYIFLAHLPYASGNISADGCTKTTLRRGDVLLTRDGVQSWTIVSGMIYTEVVISSSLRPLNEWDKLSTVSVNAGHVNMLKNKIYKYFVTHRCKKNCLAKCFLFCLNQAFKKYIIITQPNIKFILQIGISRKNNMKM